MNRICLIISLFTFSFAGNTQYDINNNEDTSVVSSKFDRQDLLSRTYVGGEFDFRIGGGFTRILVAPNVGFDIFEKFSAGISGMYQLRRLAYPNGAVITSNSFGGGVFARYRPFRKLILQTELNLYNTEDIYDPFGERVNVPVFMLGLGYVGDFGERAYYHISLLYDFVQDQNMPLTRLIPTVPIYLKYGFAFYLGRKNL